MKTHVTTERSLWEFDHEAMTFTRVPRGESASHPSKPYVSGPVEFEDLYIDGPGNVVVSYPNSTVVTQTFALEWSQEDCGS